jgi:hypothetical protein
MYIHFFIDCYYFTKDHFFQKQKKGAKILKKNNSIKMLSNTNQHKVFLRMEEKLRRKLVLLRRKRKSG